MNDETRKAVFARIDAEPQGTSLGVLVLRWGRGLVQDYLIARYGPRTVGVVACVQGPAAPTAARPAPRPRYRRRW